MSEESTAPEYMLLFRGTHWDKGLSPEEIQNVMSRWMAWFEGLTAEGKVKAGQPLFSEGKVLSGKDGHRVADGPFAESKEAIAGYFLLRVDTIDEAIAIGRMCPALEHGMTVEVRPVAQRCAAMQRAGDLLARASTEA